MWHHFQKQSISFPLILLHIWHLKRQWQTINSHQGYRAVQQRGGKRWLFLDGSPCELWRKQPVSSSNPVRKTAILEQHFFLYEMLFTAKSSPVLLGWQPSFGWGLLKPIGTPVLFCSKAPRSNALCLLDPATVLGVKANVGPGSLFLAAHWHLQNWLRSAAGISLICNTTTQLSTRSHKIPLAPGHPLGASKPVFPAPGHPPCCSLLLQRLQMRECSCSYYRTLKKPI